MSISVETLAVAKKYTDDSLAGAGAVAGVPCQIQSITQITGGHRVTFLWEDNNGDSHTSNMDVLDGEKGDPGEKGDTGLGIKSMAVNASGHLIVTYDDNTSQDAGEVPNTQADWDEESSSANSYIKNKPELGTAAAKDFTPNVAPNNHNLVESNAVYNAINTALTSVYTPRGELTCAELTSSLLIAANVGNIYEMSDAGTTTDLFLQGAGMAISVGSNVGIIQTGVDAFKFNLMANSFDLHDYQKKALDTPITIGGASQTTVEGALGAINTKETTDNLDAYKYMGMMGAKNICPVLLKTIKDDNTGGTWDGNTYTLGGVVFVVNTDTNGNVTSIAVNGTNSSDSRISFNITTFFALPVGGSYKASFEGFSGSANVYIDVGEFDGTTWKKDHIFRDGNELTITTAWPNVRVNYFVDAGASVSTNVFKPMIRYASDPDSTYQPYTLTNKEMTKKVAWLVQYPTIIYKGTTYAGLFDKIRETFGSSTPYDGFAQLICDTSNLNFIQGLIYRRGDRIAGTLFPPNNGATKEQYFVFTRTTAGQDYIGKQTLSLTELTD